MEIAFYVGASASLILLVFSTESAKWHLLNHRPKKALQILNSIAKFNGYPELKNVKLILTQ
jgi:hypothetical protein